MISDEMRKTISLLHMYRYCEYNNFFTHHCQAALLWFVLCHGFMLLCHCLNSRRTPYLRNHTISFICIRAKANSNILLVTTLQFQQRCSWVKSCRFRMRLPRTASTKTAPALLSRNFLRVLNTDAFQSALKGKTRTISSAY
jgi:hypothetical protein